VVADLKIVEADSKTALMTYNTQSKGRGGATQNRETERNHSETEKLMEDKTEKTAKEYYKKRGMGQVEPCLGHNNTGGGSWQIPSKHEWLSNLDKYVEKAIYATIGRCLVLKARAMVQSMHHH